MRALTAREQAFLWAYVGKARGNAALAGEMVGYRHPETQGPRVLRRSACAAWLVAYNQRREGVVIADADTRDRVLTEIMLDPDADKFARIGAAKELNKVTGRHSIRHIIEGKLTLEDAIAQSRRPAPELPLPPCANCGHEWGQHEAGRCTGGDGCPCPKHVSPLPGDGQ